ncbi:MAG TPA: hypothetical protein ENH40_05305 [Nitrospirae bacterium]|nr:hypothetical protein [Nitrospirota bacterium]
MHGNHLRNHVCIAAMMRRVNELSLFSGAGGGLLGTKLLGWKHIGYVEFNEYCQKVIRQRIKDGILDEAPIFSDIRAFIDQGYAEAYQDMVDVLSGGLPLSTLLSRRERARSGRSPEHVACHYRVHSHHTTSILLAGERPRLACSQVCSANFRRPGRSRV